MSSSVIPTTPPEAPGPPPDPYTYGFRDVHRVGPDGEKVWDRIPLTLEDVLHPQEGDFIAENSFHDEERGYLKNACRSQLKGVPGALVLSDCLIHWGPGGPRPLAPDVAVILGVTDPRRNFHMFYVEREGTRPRLVVEIASPHTRVNDVDTKFAYYDRLNIPEYVIVDQRREGGARELLHFRRGDQGYERVPLDPDGRVTLPVVRLRLGLRDNRLVCFDGDTGEELQGYPEEREARAQAEQARAAAEQARAGAEQVQAAAELRAREQAEARAAAEGRARSEEQARAAAEQARAQAEQARAAAEQAQAGAEQRAREQAEARAAAERQRQAEAEARAALEQRMRELEEEMRRLRGGGPA